MNRLLIVLTLILTACEGRELTDTPDQVEEAEPTDQRSLRPSVLTFRCTEDAEGLMLSMPNSSEAPPRHMISICHNGTWLDGVP